MNWAQRYANASKRMQVNHSPWGDRDRWSVEDSEGTRPTSFHFTLDDAENTAGGNYCKYCGVNIVKRTNPNGDGEEWYHQRFDDKDQNGFPRQERLCRQTLARDNKGESSKQDSLKCKNCGEKLNSPDGGHTNLGDSAWCLKYQAEPDVLKHSSTKQAIANEEEFNRAMGDQKGSMSRSLMDHYSDMYDKHNRAIDGLIKGVMNTYDPAKAEMYREGVNKHHRCRMLINGIMGKHMDGHDTGDDEDHYTAVARDAFNYSRDVSS